MISTVLILRYAFSSEKQVKESFIAIDGTKFSNQDSCNDYDNLYKKMECLYKEDSFSNSRNRKDILGLKLSFISKIKGEGFKALKTLLNCKDQFNKLVEILENSDLKSVNIKKVN